MKTGIYCPATRANCDRPCVADECQRVKLFTSRGTLLAPRPPDPDRPPLISSAQLRAARAYLNLTQAMLAVKLGVHPHTICRFEQGTWRPQEATLRKILGGLYDLGIEVFGAEGIDRGIRDFVPLAKVAKREQRTTESATGITASNGRVPQRPSE